MSSTVPIVILVDQQVRSEHFLSVCPPTIKSNARILRYSAALQQRMPFVRELPVIILNVGTQQQTVYQGDRAFQWMSKASTSSSSSSTSSSSSLSGSTRPSDTVEGYDVTYSGNGFAFLDAAGGTFMDAHGSSRYSEINGGPSATASSSSGGKSGMATRNKNDDLMEKFEQMRSSRGQ